MQTIDGPIAVGGVLSGRVLAIEDDRVRVAVDNNSGNPEMSCILLWTADVQLLHLAAGDGVLVAPLAPDGAEGVILGRIQPPSAVAGEMTDELPQPPDELVLEAKSSITLKCGDGSITLRNDGRILIKGKNLVSLALETNRIKGGSVAIN